MRYITIIW